MTLHVVQLEHRSFRLTRPGAVASSEVRGDVVLPAERARALLVAAAGRDVAAGGPYSAGPAGVQVWSGPWDGLTGGPGRAEHLGSVDWGWDTPVLGFATVYRVMLTAAGAAAGLTTDRLLDRVLLLAGLSAAQQAVPTASIPLPRDPFRSPAAARTA